VTLSDLGQVNAQVAQFVTGANFLKDVNASGTLSLADKGITNAQVTKALPAAVNEPPAVVNDTAFTAPNVGTQLNVLSNDSDPNLDTLSVVSFGQGVHGAVACQPNGSCTYTPNANFAGLDSFTYTASDGKGGQNTGTVNVNISSSDPTISAPAVKRGVATLIGSATAFLYSGANPIQTGVSAGTIDQKRVAVLRGKVTTRDGNALAGATVTIVGHPEFGQTVTRQNGFFDMAVNGGGLLSINFASPGFLPAQKQVNVPWQDYVPVPQVALIPLDSHVTTIVANAGATQMHQSSVMTDSDGSRRAIVLFPAGTTATMTFANGSTQPLTTMHVRVTEYTVGPNGLMAMPANLPALSGYTYCIELSVDEAIAAGAVGVTFSQPVVVYVENFLNFPVGTNVPVGLYDRTKAFWIPAANGRVVKVVSITGGVANVDTDGDNAGDSGLGITTAERTSLASVYAAGESLWRVPFAHFSPGDANWPFSIPDDAKSPGESGAGPDANEAQQNPNCSSGSIIECENQVLRRVIADRRHAVQPQLPQRSSTGTLGEAHH